jgi:hypothetical protein
VTKEGPKKDPGFCLNQVCSGRHIRVNKKKIKEIEMDERFKRLEEKGQVDKFMKGKRKKLQQRNKVSCGVSPCVGQFSFKCVCRNSFQCPKNETVDFSLKWQKEIFLFFWGWKRGCASCARVAKRRCCCVCCKCRSAWPKRSSRARFCCDKRTQRNSALRLPATEKPSSLCCETQTQLKLGAQTLVEAT